MELKYNVFNKATIQMHQTDYKDSLDDMVKDTAGRQRFVSLGPEAKKEYGLKNSELVVMEYKDRCFAIIVPGKDENVCITGNLRDRIKMDTPEKGDVLNIEYIAEKGEGAFGTLKISQPEE